MPYISKEETEGLEPIAIVGMACRLPGAINSPSEFWQLLRDKQSVRTPQVPLNRFNIAAHNHPDLSRPGSFPSLGGYFLAGDPVDLDPSFFNMTPVEAAWLDPQQRKMLEVCYEVFENAGLKLEDVAGSNTGVYAASFTSDYQQMSIWERDFRHNYAATGVDTGILSARVNNTFNLNGPSQVVNTACSSALYAIHNACAGLRSGDCDAAIASGSNIILMVDQHMNTAKLGVLSPTSECHTFDASADGYGRAEAVGALYLKRLSDAIRDKDLIRGVIRTSAVNTNGKVDGMGITFPNEHGQERVLRKAYERANLDPKDTAYLECHGTGTPTGDPIEVKAVARGMNDTRSKEKPLILGAAKANIGHSEAASGIFATMKAALMTEAGEIPGVHGFKNLNPAIKDKDWNVEIARELMPWPEGFDVRRASVSSFGYGGTNAHLVVEAVESLCPWYEHGSAKIAAKYTYAPAAIDRPFLVTMSAHDQKTLKRNISAHEEVASNYHLPDLAYTLNDRRTQFAGARGYTVAWPGAEKAAFSPTKFTYGSKLPGLPKGTQPEIGFVLTGQGAQWARMGCEAMQRFPRFRETIDALDRVLQRLVDPKPHWSLREILEAPAESSEIGKADISQPACTAIQVAVIDLFSSWDIKPAVAVGHSSGEIAAAYAAGRISAPEAILAAYFRGLAVASAAPIGTMLAVGLGASQIQEYLDFLPADVLERVSIACENSPASTTLSGAVEDILAVKKIMDDFGIFARQLKTGKAYHSSQMDKVAPLYEQLYAQADAELSEKDLSWRQPLAGLVSSVTGRIVDESQESIGISYWCDNLRCRVRFDAAVQTLCRDVDFANVKLLVEIGPHSALKGPIEQILAENSFNLSYVGSLVRKEDDAVSLLRTAGELYLRGLHLDFDMVNNLNLVVGATALSTKGGSRSHGRCLVDLPPYQWNYERQYWNEPRAIADLRASKHPRHDVLGRRLFGLSSNAPTWKNVLRQRDVKWFPDHTLGTDVVFPAAGHVALAIEALLQQLDLEPAEAGGVKLADIDISRALMVPDSDDGIEVHTRLEKVKSDNEWYTFTVESVTQHEGKDLWTTHSSGRVRRSESSVKSTNDCPYQPIQLHQQVAPKRWYRALDRVGFRYGPSFQTMTQHVRANGKDRWASSGIRIQAKQTDLESRYILHPSTIDGCLHAVIAAVHRGLLKEMPWGVVPLTIEDMSVNFPKTHLANDGHCFAWVDEDPSSSRHFLGNVQLFTDEGDSPACIMDIRNLRMVSYEAALPPTAAEPSPREPYTRVDWKPYGAAEAHLLGAVNDQHMENRRITVLVQNNEYPLPSSALSKVLRGTPTFLPGTTLESLQDSDAIVIDDENGSVLACPIGDGWMALQKVLLQSDKPIVWVTRGANQGASVNSGLPQGFLRAVRSEAPTVKICLIDADSDVSVETVARSVLYQLDVFDGRIGTEDADMDPQREAEWWLTSEQKVLIPRLESEHALNRLADGHNKDYKAETMVADSSYTGALVDDHVVWEELSEITEIGLLDVEIQVQLTEITKSDLSIHPDGAGARLITGTIIRTGDGLDSELAGRSVVAYMNRKPGNFLDTRVVTSAFAVLGDNHQNSTAELVVSLSQIAKSVEALDETVVTLENLYGRRVVVVAETGESSFTQGLNKLAAHLGFQVSLFTNATGGGSEVHCLLSRADVVITAGAPRVELIHDIWQNMPSNSTFVFGGGTPVEMYSPLSTKPLMRDVRLKTCGRNSKSALETSVALLTKFTDLAQPLSPVTAVEVQHLSDSESVEQVRKSMVKTGGTGILQISYGETQIKVKPSVRRAEFAANAAYLLVGCLGGLGRSLTTWMLERGCKNFVFLSRSGATKPEAIDVVNRLTAAGAHVQVHNVDAGDEKAVASVVERVSAELPIKGVVHAAMVLADGLYENMSFAAYQTALRPKMQGAIALDRALGDTPLDFFLMTSSISAVLGNPGQANYCAANSYLDFLALQRRRKGLAACSIALPAVEDVGVVAENVAVAEALARKMPFGINEKEMLAAFEAAILHGQPSASHKEAHLLTLGDVQLVVGFEPDAMLHAIEDEQVDISDAFWSRDARMSSILGSLEAKQKARGAAGSGQGSEKRSFATMLSGLPEEEIINTLGQHIIERCARILGSDKETFQFSGRSLGNHGVDSMIGVELQRWVFTEFGLQVSVTTLSNPKTTFASLASTVAGHLGLIAKEDKC